MNSYVNAICKSVHYHICTLRHICSSIGLTDDMAKMVVCALVGSRLDYANSVLFGITQKNISKLQKTQNLLAHAAISSPQSCSSRTLLQPLYWLPIKHCIDFKIANITFRILHSSQPAYLHNVHPCMPVIVIPLIPSDSNTNLLSAPFVRTSFGACNFSAAPPKIWKSLPPFLHTCTSPHTFHCHLKTHYCSRSSLRLRFSFC